MQLNKTNIKGLYLTNEGKAWHKSAKREIPATTNGKVRFNGKLYDLQKIIDFSQSNTTKNKGAKPKPAVKKGVSITELQTQGFRKTKISGLFITNNGKGYNVNTKKSLSIVVGKIIVNGKAYNVSKLILETFCKIAVRSGQINFKNGNDQDFYFENIEYKSTIKQLPPSEVDLIQCIRLYFEVDKKLKRSNILFKYYLNEIALKRGFIYLNKDTDFSLFLEWLKPFNLNQTKAIISEKHGYTVRNATNTINKYLAMLVNECLQDQENGLLEVKDFLKPKPTKTQKLKEAQKSVNEMGLNIKIPLRKPSQKEQLKKFLSNDTNKPKKTN